MAAILTAPIWQSRFVEDRLALLAEEFLHDAVSAAAAFQLAHTGTSVEVPEIAVIALLTGCLDSVATPKHETRLQRALSAAAVTVSGITILTLLMGLQYPVSAARSGAQNALSVPADIAFTLDVGHAFRAVSLEALCARRTLRGRPAPGACAVYAESAHTLEIGCALCAVSVQTLCALRAITIIRASRACPLDTLPTPALAVSIARFAGAVHACLARGAVFPVSAGAFDGAESAAAVLIETVSVVTLFPRLEDSVSARDPEALRIAGTGVRPGSGSRSTPLILTGEVRGAPASSCRITAVGSDSRHRHACISAAFQM